MIPASLLFLLASSNLELGGSLGIGRLLGEPSAAQGRDPSVADPIRNLWTSSAWLGYTWRRGHLLALRFDQADGSGSLGRQEDLGEDLEEKLVLRVFGIEYVAMRPQGFFDLRMGGGLGYATATDRLETDQVTLRAKGSGIAAWVRSGVVVPFAGTFRWHLEGVGEWSSFSSMKSPGLDPYKTDFPVVRLETGLSLGL